MSNDNISNEELLDYFDEVSRALNETLEQLSEVEKQLENLNKAVDNIQKYIFDVNIEKNNQEEYTLLAAIRTVPESRRVLGLKIRFKRSGGNSEYSYIGKTTDSTEWTKTENWSAGNTNIIDGGTF